MSQYEGAYMYQGTPNNIWSSIHEKAEEHWDWAEEKQWNTRAMCEVRVINWQ